MPLLSAPARLRLVDTAGDGVSASTRAYVDGNRTPAPHPSPAIDRAPSR